MMLTCHCSRNSLDPSKAMKKIIKNAAVSDDIHDLILHLFNMPELKTSG